MSDAPCRFWLSDPPPSTNNLYRGRRWKTDEYTLWTGVASWEVRAQRPQPVAGRVRVRIEAPFKLNRDIDNIKPLLDLAATLGLIENDNRVDELLIVRVAASLPTTVSIWPLANGGAEGIA